MVATRLCSIAALLFMTSCRYELTLTPVACSDHWCSVRGLGLFAGGPGRHSQGLARQDRHVGLGAKPGCLANRWEAGNGG